MMTRLFPKRMKASRSQRRTRLGVALLAGVVGLLLLGMLGVAAAQVERPITLGQGQDVDVACRGGLPSLVATPGGGYRLTCGSNDRQPNERQPNGARVASVPVTGTPTGAGMEHASGHDEVGACGEPMDRWHPPVVNSCATGHEHGDEPPSWITKAGYAVAFHGHFNTSPTEHTLKHAGMKGFLARFADVDIYFRVHATSNVLDRAARYHSYEVWARDPSGAVSHWQGWYNSGDPLVDRLVRRRGVEPEKRPVVLVVDEASWEQGIKCEQWYAATAVWSWDFGWTICGVNSLYYSGEADEQGQQFWRAPPGGPGVGTLRRLEAAWYDNTKGRMHPVGQFWATQFGDIVSGEDDPQCSESTTKYGVTYDNICLEQYIAPTMKQVAYPDINAEQRQFDGTGVKAPN